MNEGRKFGLLSRPGLQCLLELAACGRRGHAHRLCGNFETVSVGHGYCGLRFAIGQTECVPKRFD